MPLPVLPSRHEPARDDLVRLFHRTDETWIQHLAEPEQLDSATAYANPALDQVPYANHVRNAALPPGTTPEQAVADVQAFFTRAKTRCHFWLTNPSAPADQTQPLIDHLLSLGHRPHPIDILYLRHLPKAPVPQAGGLTIIPARAAYRHIEHLARQHAAERRLHEQHAQARLQHLDDPHVDALIALKDQQPAGHVDVLAVGELGRIEHLYTAPTFRRQHIAQTLMSRALEICARSLFKHVFLMCPPTNHPAQSLYRKLGFEKLADLTAYEAPTPAA
jgi:GNAT superfamily N-acetyltransferase